MGNAQKQAPSARAGSTGWLVLGMHRSGTTALARLLAESGFDAGTRLVQGSSGNEAGHWEDAYAVEVHERLLAAFGARWDEPGAVPEHWAKSDASARARDGIRAYLGSDRARHAAWVLKDPRASLFAPLWIEEAERAGMGLGAVLMLRHPMEVAASLAARDGLSLERGLWLWLEYTAAAAIHASAVPNMVIGYDQLLTDWRACARLLGQLPGGELLRKHVEPAMVDQWLDPRLRHHAGPQPPLPEPLERIWQVMSAGVGNPLDPATIEELFGAYRSIQGLLHPLAADWRWRHRQLWERTSRAEGLVVRDASKDRDAVAQLQDLVVAHGRDVIDAFSSDIQSMQATTQDAIRAHASVAGEYSELRRASDRLLTELSAARDELAPLRLRATGLAEQLSIAEGRARLAEQEKVQIRQASELLQQAHDALQSHAIGLQDALRDAQLRLGARNRELTESAETLDQVLRSRSWRWSRPFRVAMRLLSGRWGNEDRKKLRAVFGRPAPGGTMELPGDSTGPDPAERSRATANAARELTRQVPLAEASGQADVFVWAVIDWHFRTQRPQHLARAMSGQGHRVFYVSNNFEDAAAPGFRIEPLDDSGRLFQVHLHLPGRPAIYFGMPDEAQLECLRASFACLLGWTRTRSSLSIVQHPFWQSLAMSCPNARLVYDCMDHHAGFENNASDILRGELELIADADLVVVTSDDLGERIGTSARNVSIVRNGCDYTFFSTIPARVYRQPEGRQVIGYFGAIAAWFDVELVRAVARANPDAEVLLIGCDTTDCGARLADEQNVRMVGEVPYVDLPYWLHGFDVCMLPFQVVPLTLATNPVKVYEYLAAGKPVAVVDLPEMAQFGDLVSIAADQAAFVDAVKCLLADDSGSARRQAFAAGQTWGHRAEAFDRAVSDAPDPMVSVIVLTYNNWAYTQACLQSLDDAGDYGNLEIVVVDNASTDGSVERLKEWQAQPARAGQVRRLILNPKNTGFAAGNNIGLEAATGEFLALLNNDTYVTPGWIRTLCAHFRSDASLGLLGPVTNNIGNEARIDIAYTDMREMVEQAKHHTLAHPGQRHPMRTVAFFCVAMPRRVYEAVGGLDEAYGIGFFEDDDYCRRVERAGYKVACAEDVFVHHHLSATFEQLESGARQELFNRNKAIYESKWGAWRPHQYRESSGPAPCAEA